MAKLQLMLVVILHAEDSGRLYLIQDLLLIVVVLAIHQILQIIL